MMIRIKSSHLLIDGRGFDARSGDLRKLIDAAMTFNRQNPEGKLKIFRSRQVPTYSLEQSGGSLVLVGWVRKRKLTETAVSAIVRYGHCLLDNCLFIFDQKMSDEIELVLANPSDVVEKVSGVYALGERLQSIEQLDSYLDQLTEAADGRPEISVKIDLYPYQKIGLTWLSQRYKSREGALLADDMGLGKTAQVIALIAEEMKRGALNRTLVVAPNSLLANWQREFEKFSVGITPYLHWGAARLGFSSSLRRHQVVISTYATVVQDRALFDQISFDLLVLDEASLIKNPDSQRTEVVKSLNRAHTIAMTGTPFENSPMDVWSIVDTVSEGYLGTKPAFISAYMSAGGLELTQSQTSELEAAVSSVMLRRMKHEVLEDLPARVDVHKPLTMTPEEHSNYAKLEWEIKSSLHDRTLTLARIAHLRKLTSHPLLYQGQIHNASFEALLRCSSKFEYLNSKLREILQRRQKALVFANHIDLLNAFTRAFGDRYCVPVFKIDGSVEPYARQTVVDEFSNIDGGAILFLNPMTAGMGLNITSANHVIHYSRQWNPALEEQATARAYRNGQSLAVNVYFLYYARTIEEIIHDRIVSKLELNESLIIATQLQDLDEIYLSGFGG
jgi:SNF2 family DNA or RNA helicase